MARSDIARGEAWSPAEKNKGREREKKKGEGKESQKASLSRGDATRRLYLDKLSLFANNYELMNVTVAMAMSIAHNCFIFISHVGTRALTSDE